MTDKKQNTLGVKNRTPRADRQAGVRTEFERLRKIVLQTQTICNICGKPVDINRKPPDPLSPSVDHIIPVSVRPDLACELSNLALTHRICNQQKSNKILVAEVRDEREKQVSNRLLPQHNDWERMKI